jgi:hypothetical protein
MHFISFNKTCHINFKLLHRYRERDQLSHKRNRNGPTSKQFNNSRIFELNIYHVHFSISIFVIIYYG